MFVFCVNESLKLLTRLRLRKLSGLSAQSALRSLASSPQHSKPYSLPHSLPREDPHCSNSAIPIADLLSTLSPFRPRSWRSSLKRRLAPRPSSPTSRDPAKGPLLASLRKCFTWSLMMLMSLLARARGPPTTARAIGGRGASQKFVGSIPSIDL